MAGEQERVDGYLATVDRLEPNIHPIDASAFYASAAISLKRMADDTRRAADAIEEYIKWLQSQHKETEKRRDQYDDEWLRRKGLGDLVKTLAGDGLPSDEV